MSPLREKGIESSSQVSEIWKLQIREQTSQLVRTKQKSIHSSIRSITGHSIPERRARVQVVVPIGIDYPTGTSGGAVQGKERIFLVLRKGAGNGESHCEEEKQPCTHGEENTETHT